MKNALLTAFAIWLVLSHAEDAYSDNTSRQSPRFFLHYDMNRPLPYVVRNEISKSEAEEISRAGVPAGTIGNEMALVNRVYYEAYLTDSGRINCVLKVSHGVPEWRHKFTYAGSETIVEISWIDLETDTIHTKRHQTNRSSAETVQKVARGTELLCD